MFFFFFLGLFGLYFFFNLFYFILCFYVLLFVFGTGLSQIYKIGY
jgi:hypothetical protein